MTFPIGPPGPGWPVSPSQVPPPAQNISLSQIPVTPENQQFQQGLFDVHSQALAAHYSPTPEQYIREVLEGRRVVVPGEQMAVVALFYALEHLPMGVAMKFLKSGLDPVFSVDGLGRNVVQRTVAHRSSRELGVLLQALKETEPQDPVLKMSYWYLLLNDADPYSKDTPLITALAGESDTSKASMLLRAGALPDFPNLKGDYPLLVAVNLANFSAVKLLVTAGARIPIISRAGVTTPLMCARYWFSKAFRRGDFDEVKRTRDIVNLLVPLDNGFSNEVYWYSALGHVCSLSGQATILGQSFDVEGWNEVASHELMSFELTNFYQTLISGIDDLSSKPWQTVLDQLATLPGWRERMEGVVKGKRNEIGAAFRRLISIFSNANSFGAKNRQSFVVSVGAGTPVCQLVVARSHVVGMVVLPRKADGLYRVLICNTGEGCQLDGKGCPGIVELRGSSLDSILSILGDPLQLEKYLASYGLEYDFLGGFSDANGEVSGSLGYVEALILASARQGAPLNFTGRIIRQKEARVGNCTIANLASLELALATELLEPVIGEGFALELARACKRVRRWDNRLAVLLRYFENHRLVSSHIPWDFQFLSQVVVKCMGGRNPTTARVLQCLRQPGGLEEAERLVREFTHRRFPRSGIIP